jgi:hypothetical protein
VASSTRWIDLGPPAGQTERRPNANTRLSGLTRSPPEGTSGSPSWIRRLWASQHSTPNSPDVLAHRKSLATRRATYYRHPQSAVTGRPGTPSPFPPTAATYTITGLTNGTTYYVTVKAINAIGNSAASNETSERP